MEFDFDAAHRGPTADAADLRAARAVARDGEGFGDGEPVYVQVKRAAVFTVGTEEASLRAAPQAEWLGLQRTKERR